MRENKQLLAQMEALKKENTLIIGLSTADPFRKLHGAKEIAAYFGWSKGKLYMYRDELHACGAIGYEYTGAHAKIKRLIAHPYLIMRYFQHRNKQSKGYYQEENRNVQRSTT